MALQQIDVDVLSNLDPVLNPFIDTERYNIDPRDFYKKVTGKSADDLVSKYNSLARDYQKYDLFEWARIPECQEMNPEQIRSPELNWLIAQLDNIEPDQYIIGILKELKPILLETLGDIDEEFKNAGYIPLKREDLTELIRNIVNEVFDERLKAASVPNTWAEIEVGLDTSETVSNGLVATERSSNQSSNQIKEAFKKAASGKAARAKK